MNVDQIRDDVMRREWLRSERGAADRSTPLILALLAGAAGAIAAYFLDPDNGRRRRKMAVDRLGATFRRGATEAERAGRRVSSTAYGLTQRATHIAGTTSDPSALLEKVESELFRDPSIPKGRMNINAENGTIVLRGEVDSAEQIGEIEARVRAIGGVGDIENLLHVTGTPAPTAAR